MFKKFFQEGLKGPLLLAGALAGSGGVTGLVHSSPKILLSTGLACESVVATTEKPSEQKNVSINWGGQGGDGPYSELPWENGIENTNVPYCYKRIDG